MVVVVHRRIRPLPKVAVGALHLGCIPIDLLKWAPPYPTPPPLLLLLLLQALLHSAMGSMGSMDSLDNMDTVITAIQCLHLETLRGRDLGCPRALFRWSPTCLRALHLVATDRPGRVVDEDSWQALTICSSKPRPPCRTKDGPLALALTLPDKCLVILTFKFWPEETWLLQRRIAQKRNGMTRLLEAAR